MKYIDVELYFVREEISRGSVKVVNAYSLWYDHKSFEWQQIFSLHDIIQLIGDEICNEPIEVSVLSLKRFVLLNQNGNLWSFLV